MSRLVGFEEAAEGVREWIGLIVARFGCGFGGASGCAVHYAAHVRGEGGVGGGASDLYRDAVAESGAGDISDDSACCACCCSAGDHAHELACDAACSCCGAAFSAGSSEEAGELEEDVVVESAGCADGSGSCGRADGGNDERDVVGADVAAVDVDIGAERLDGGAGAAFDSGEGAERA